MNQRANNNKKNEPPRNPDATQIPTVTLSFEKRPVRTDLWSRVQLWHGEPKIGKTVQANNIPGGSFFLKFEPGHDHITHMGESISSWEKFIGVVRSLTTLAQNARKRGERLPFQTVVVDTAGQAYRRCRDFICKKLGIVHEGDVERGKGYAMIENEFGRVINHLCLLGFGVVMIAHSTETEKKRKTKGGEWISWKKLVVDLPKGGDRVIPPMADLILFFCKEYDEQTDQWRRVIKTKGNDYFMAGVRYPPEWKFAMPDTLPMNFEALVQCWERGRPDQDQRQLEPPTPEPEADAGVGSDRHPETQYDEGPQRQQEPQRSPQNEAPPQQREQRPPPQQQRQQPDQGQQHRRTGTRLQR